MRLIFFFLKMQDFTSLKLKLALCNEDEVDGYHLFKWEKPSTED